MLEINDLRKSYRHKEVLKGMSLKISEGEFVGLLGQNGAGKTTFINIITCLATADAGTINIFNTPLYKNKKTILKQLGVLPQENNYSLIESAQEVILNQAGYFGIKKRIAKEKANHYLKLFGMSSYKNLAMQSLSGGMQRIVMFIRAIINDPKLLILDEPSIGVDLNLRLMIWDVLKEFNQAGTTILMTSHYANEIETLCKRILLLDKGIVTLNTSMSELIKNKYNDVYKITCREKLDEKLLVSTVLYYEKISDNACYITLNANTPISTALTPLIKNQVVIETIEPITKSSDELFSETIANASETI